MINIIDSSPKVLSDKSRDYQLLARLYTTTFNYSKMCTDSDKIWEADIDPRLSLLRAYTLNFIPKHEWDLNMLKSISTSFKYLMKYKGSKKVLENCIQLFARISGVDNGAWRVEVKDDKILIYMTHQQATLANIKDVLDYVLPAGFTYRIIQYNTIEDTPFTEFKAHTQEVKIRQRADSKANLIAKDFNDVGTIMDDVQGRTSQGIISNEKGA